jgi:DNA-binding CsgD family transcriptional regulator/sugar-specific transcriptional regulator TrmB
LIVLIGHNAGVSDLSTVALTGDAAHVTIAILVGIEPGGRAVMLGALGLSAAAEAVYTAMLKHGDADLMDLVTYTGLTETAVRMALDELADHTFVRPSRRAPGRLRVVSPQVALNLILRMQEADLARRAGEFAAARAAAAAAIAEYSLAYDAMGDIIERLNGIDAVTAKLELLADVVEDECLSVMPGGAQSQAGLEASRPLDDSALHRGVTLYTLYQDSMRNDPATYTYAQWLTEHGGEVRTAPLLPPRMLIFDRRIAVIPIDPDNTKIGALCTYEAGIVASLVAIFRQAWTTAVPLGADREPDEGTGLTAIERDLLILLAQGMTDEAAAKRLGIGLRTVRRQMAGIMERLDASSRFEAGLKAAHNGWL